MEWLTSDGLFIADTGPQHWVATQRGAPRKGLQADCGALVAELEDSSWIEWTQSHPEFRRKWKEFGRVLLEEQETAAVLHAQTILHEMRAERVAQTE
jgi:chemotaxis signal transduction protein